MDLAADPYERRKLLVREHRFNQRFMKGPSSIDGGRQRALPPVQRELPATPPHKMTRKEQTALANRLIGLDNDPTASNAFMVDGRTLAALPMPAHGYKGWTFFDMRNVRNAAQILAEKQLAAIQALGQEVDDLTVSELGEHLPPPPPKRKQAEQELFMRKMTMGQASTSKEKLRRTVVGQVAMRLGSNVSLNPGLGRTWAPGTEFSMLPAAAGCDMTFMDSTNPSTMRFTSAQGMRYARAEPSLPRAKIMAKSMGSSIPFNTSRRVKRRRKRELELFRGRAHASLGASRPKVF